MATLTAKVLREGIRLKTLLLKDRRFIKNIDRVAYLMVSALSRGGQVLFCGNGGSAADAQHLAAELSGRFYFDRPPLNAEALHANTSFLTAVANDYGYDQVFARLVGAKIKSQDVLVGLSTSGNSHNIILAFEMALSHRAITIGFTGQGGGEMAHCSEVLLAVPSVDTPRIQECHIVIGHIICQLVEQRMFPAPSGK